MTRLWFQRAVCVAVLSCCLGSTEGAATSVDRQRSADSQVLLQVRQPFEDARLLVRWQRVPTRDGGQYLLYRGTDRDSLQRVARITVGDRDSFEVEDAALWEGRRIYQLRYLDRHGREHVLTTVLLELSHIEQQLDLGLAAGVPQPLELALSRPPQWLEFHDRLSPVVNEAPTGDESAPPSPPPRRLDTSLERTTTYAWAAKTCATV